MYIYICIVKNIILIKLGKVRSTSNLGIIFFYEYFSFYILTIYYILI